MARLGEVVSKVRSKNAGPFWLTLDIFCGSGEVFERVAARLDTGAVARAFGVEQGVIRRFDIEGLAVVKISLPRPQVQGAALDREMHGASFAEILAAVEIG